MEILKIQNLSFTYPGAEKETLREINLSMEEGELLLLCGETGCGKSTLVRLIKNEIAPAGERKGEILYRGSPVGEMTPEVSAREIGIVGQDPESQIVTDKVWHELAFGLENLGVKSEEIRSRVGEIASYFGIGNWFEKNTAELSGGQKQLLNLASVMVMQPRLLILDEPTAQLDPIAASEFLSAVSRLNRELSVTVLLVEHRLEDVYPLADKIAAMQDGQLLFTLPPQKAAAETAKYPRLIPAMPAAARIFLELGGRGECPVSVREGRRFIEENYGDSVRALPRREIEDNGETALSVQNVWFRYSKDEKDVLRDLSFSVRRGEIFCILGDNAGGKTTALNAVAGLIRPREGSIRLFGKKLASYKGGSLYKNNIAMLPQDAKTVFVREKVGEDLEMTEDDKKLIPFDISHLSDRHPFDLSGGEQQLCALCKALLQRPRLLILDEPTKGVDAWRRRMMIEILQKLRGDGMTILVVTHDLEFAAACADRCALFLGGAVLSVEERIDFFSKNNFYTTVTSRITRPRYDGIITTEDAAEICRRNS